MGPYIGVLLYRGTSVQGDSYTGKPLHTVHTGGSIERSSHPGGPLHMGTPI